jgi:hypothetical protein
MAHRTGINLIINITLHDKAKHPELFVLKRSGLVASSVSSWAEIAGTLPCSAVERSRPSLAYKAFLWSPATMNIFSAWVNSGPAAAQLYRSAR